MLMFEYTGRDRRQENRFRRFFMGTLLAAGALLLFPFTLLAFFLWCLAYCSQWWSRKHQPAGR